MTKAADYRYSIHQIRQDLQRGVITYDQARYEARPIIDEINYKGRLLAKKHKVNYKPVTFAGLMR